MKRYAVLIVFLLLAGDVFGRGWYVKLTTGSDSAPNDGTYALPYASVWKAATMAQAGDTVYVYGGSHTIPVITQNSGTPAYPIVYRAEQPCSLYQSSKSTTPLTITGKHDIEFHGITIRGGKNQALVSGGSRRIRFYDCTILDRSECISCGQDLRAVDVQGSYNIQFWRCDFWGAYDLYGVPTSGPTYTTRGQGIGHRNGADTLLLVDCTFQWYEHWAVASAGTDSRNIVVLNSALHDNHGGFNTAASKKGVYRFNTIYRSNLDAYTTHQGGPFQLNSDSTIFSYNITYHDTTTYSWKYFAQLEQINMTGTVINNRGTRFYNNTIWCKNLDGTTTFATTLMNIRDNNPGGNVFNNLKTWNNLIVRGTRPASPDTFLNVNDANYTIGSWPNYFDGNMFTTPNPTYFLKWKGTYYTLPAAKLADPTAWKSGNVLSYPTHLDTSTAGVRGTFAITDPASNLVDAGVDQTTVTVVDPAGLWIRVGDPLWFFDGRGVVPADSIRVGTEGALISRMGGDTIFVSTVGSFVIGEAVNVLAAWDGNHYRTTLSGTKPDIGAIEYGQSTGLEPSGTLTADAELISAPTSVTFTWTSQNADSVHFETERVMPTEGGDTTFTVSATQTYYLYGYWNGGQQKQIASKMITYGPPVVPGTNLLHNGSFERSTGWYYGATGGTGNGYLRRETGEAQDSTTHAEITFGTVLGTNNQLTTTSGMYIPLETGKTYTLDFYAKSSAATDSFYVRVLDYDTPNDRYKQEKVSITSAWTQYSLTWVQGATDPTAMLQFLFYLTGVAQYAHGIGDKILLDGVRIYENVLASPPTLISPISSVEVDSAYVLFRWTPGGSVASHLQVDDARNMATPAYSDTTITSDNQQVTGLVKGTEYFWRVRSKSAAGWSAYSGIDSVTIYTTLPSTPAIVSPSNGEKYVDIVPALYWTGGTAASQFLIQIATDASFDSLVYNDSTTNAAPTWTPDPLTYVTGFYWRVKAKNSDGYSAWSDPQDFQTSSKAGLAPRRATHLYRP